MFAPQICIWITVLISSWAIYPLNENLIAINSADGRQYLTECLQDDQQTFLTLILHWETQSTPTYCAVASSVAVLNALNLPGPVLPGFPANFTYFSQTNLLSLPGVKHSANEADARKRGMTLDVLARVLELAAGPYINTDVIRADTDDVDGFRERILKSVYSNTSFILVNYNRESVNQIGGGHVSPIGAYHPDTDQLLILDVAKHKYPPVWVSLSDFFQAMNTTDPISNSTRGYLIISTKEIGME